jgi:hypothetical protein
VPADYSASVRTRIESPLAGVLVRCGGRARTAAITNGRGTARLSVRPTGKGVVTLAITGPGIETQRHALIAT